MNSGIPSEPVQATRSPSAKLLHWGARILLLMAVMDGLLFGAAGRLDWPGAWVWTGMYLAFLIVFVLWTTRRAPDLLRERGRMAPNVKRWDKVILSFYTLMLLGLLITAGLDARFRWSTLTWGWQAAGVVLAIGAGGLIFWTTQVNVYLSRYARIQDDRGQQVVREGPYQYVRHPMYAAIIPLMLGLALVLGSWWALVPAVGIGILYVLRAALEDRMLLAELPGYAEYAGEVRYRLVPGIW